MPNHITYMEHIIMVNYIAYKLCNAATGVMVNEPMLYRYSTSTETLDYTLMAIHVG